MAIIRRSIQGYKVQQNSSTIVLDTSRRGAMKTALHSLLAILWPGGTLTNLLMIISILIIYKLHLSKWSQRMRLALSLPGPKALPFIGNTYLATKNKELIHLGNTAYQSFGPIFRVWISVVPVFFVMEPEDLKVVLRSHNHINKNYLYSLMNNVLGEGLVLMSGDAWEYHRRLIQTTFTNSILENYVPIFSKHTNDLIKDFSIAIKAKPTINITTIINRCIFKVLNEAVLGLGSDDKVYESSPFTQSTFTTLQRIKNPWKILSVLYNCTRSGSDELKQNNNLKTFTRQLIRKRRGSEHSGPNESGFQCLLNRMLDISETNKSFNENSIVDEVCTFMLVGQDSVSSAVAFCLYYLADNPDIQDSVYEEQSEIFGDSDRPITVADLNEMTYLGMCIKETLRLCPSVPLMSRRLAHDTRIANHTLPEGSDVFISPIVTHRLPHVYPDPFKFDPSRFTEEEVSKRDRYAFIPFSAGPRNCIGYKFAMLEMKTLISTVVRCFHLAVREGYELELSYKITLRAKGGIWLQVKPR